MLKDFPPWRPIFEVRLSLVNQQIPLACLGYRFTVSLGVGNILYFLTSSLLFVYIGWEITDFARHPNEVGIYLQPYENVIWSKTKISGRNVVRLNTIWNHQIIRLISFCLSPYKIHWLKLWIGRWFDFQNKSNKLSSDEFTKSEWVVRNYSNKSRLSLLRCQSAECHGHTPRTGARTLVRQET